jgi:flagellar motor switch protein FliM
MSTREILSDDEAEALREKTVSNDPQGPAPAGHIVDLHADHWERILADRAPALESISDRMSSLLKITARKFFRRPVDVTPRPWRAERWGLYARRLPVPTSLNVIELRAQNSKGVIALDADFVYTLVDVFFAGDGKGKRLEAAAEFTPVELRLVRKFVTAILEDMQEAWKPFMALDLKLGASEISPIFAAVATASDPVCVTGFDLTLLGRDLRFEIVLPEAVVEPIRHLQDAAQPGQAEAGSRRWQNQLKADVQEARVSLRAVLGRTEISLRDITQAKPGDIIPTDTPGTVILYAGDTPLLEGTFGNAQGRNAVRITKPANRKTVGEKYGRGEDI